MPLSLITEVPGGAEGWAKVDENFAAIQSFVNSLAAQIFAVSGDGAQLLLDLFDRPGIVGSHSYVLDTDSYAGGAEIVIGRRPEPDPIQAETDVSVAFGTFGGEKLRVSREGDVTLDASPIVSDLPKTIYVGIVSSGMPQLFEDNVTGGVLYIYSMTWNGSDLSNFKRLGRYLPAYTLIQMIAKRCQEIAIFDPLTDFFADTVAIVRLPLHGSAFNNEVPGLDMAVEILGGYVDVPKAGTGYYDQSGAADTLRLKFMMGADKINLGNLDIELSDAPTRVYFAVDAATLGSKRFVTDVKSITIERVSVGADVDSAKGATFGLFVRPLHGNIPLPKDTDAVDQI